MVLGARWAVENATSRLCVWQGRDVHSSWPELEVGAKEPRRGEMEPTVQEDGQLEIVQSPGIPGVSA